MTPAGRVGAILLLLLSGLAGFLFALYREKETAPVPVRETLHAPATFVRQIQNDPLAGRKIFEAFCATCHAETPQIAVMAPRIGDSKAWAIRRRMGRDTLLFLTLRGAGAMPARGGCFECSDKQVQQAIDYIMQQSGQRRFP